MSDSIRPTRRFLLTAGALGAVLPLRRPALAASWPAQPVRLVVPFVAGGSTDILARQLAERLRPGFGQPVIVENRGGAGGTVGSDSVAKAAPDGYTLLVGVTGTHGTAPSIYPNLPYDPARDFVAISRLVTAPLVIVVRADSPIRTLADLVAAAKAEPGRLTYGTPGAGTSMHLTGLQFSRAAGTQLSHVPYRGSAPAFADLLGGRLSSLFGDLLIALPHIRDGGIRALAVTSAGRSPSLPDVPTVAESGFPGFEALSWQGLFAPAGTPPSIVARIHAEVAAAMAAPDLKRFFADQGFESGSTTPEAFQAFVESEIRRWAEVVRAGGAGAL